MKDGPSGLFGTHPSRGIAWPHWAMRPRLRVRRIGSGPVATTPPTRQGRFRAGRDARARATIAAMVERVLLASPRGYCAGVERAVETVELALEHYGAPVYVRKQIVHNIHVVRDLEARGAIFVDDEPEAPEGATIVFSAHGVAPSVHASARPRSGTTDRRDLPARDEGARAGAPVRRRRLHGHPHRPRRPRGGRRDDGRGARVDRARRGVAEARGARPPGRTRSSPTSRRRRSRSTRPARSSRALRRRFPAIRAPKKEDICYATSNRQWAVKEMLDRGRPAARDRLAQLVELEPPRRRRARRRRRLVPDRRRDRDRRGAGSTASSTVGITSGASAPEKLVQRVCDWFRARGVERIEPFRMVDEDVTFRLPVELRRELALAESQR